MARNRVLSACRACTFPSPRLRRRAWTRWTPTGPWASLMTAASTRRSGTSSRCDAGASEARSIMRSAHFATTLALRIVLWSVERSG